MYNGYTIDRKQLFRALCNVEFPALSPLRSELDLMDFKNGMGIQTLSTHTFNFFEELLNMMNTSSTEIDLHEFKRLFPDESISKIERIYNTINQKCQKIDIIDFEDYLLRIDDVLLRDIMCSWKQKIKTIKNIEIVDTLERAQLIKKYAMTENEYEWLERKFNILDYNHKNKISKDDAIILFESGMIDVGREIDLHFNNITKEEITLKEFLIYIYGPIKLQQNALENIIVDNTQLRNNEEKSESRVKVVRNESEDIESLITVHYNDSFEHSRKKSSSSYKKNSRIYKLCLTFRSFFFKHKT